MLNYDLMCNICACSEIFSLNVLKKDIFKKYHHISKNIDICPRCASKIILNKEWIETNELIIRNLTKKEKELIVNYLNL